MRCVAGFTLLLVACSPASPPSAPPRDVDVDAGFTVPPVDAGTPPAKAAHTKPLDTRCPPVQVGQISDDETPSIKGPTTSTEIFAWFEARGVPKEKLLSFLAGYWGRGLKPTDAETYFQGECKELVVGDKDEPALLCVQGLPEGLIAAHAIGLVVRNKKPAVVLDVGLHMVALDWPDARWLDLQLEVKSALTLTLSDRAPDGVTLVSPPSFCKEREATLDQCEKDWPSEPNPESYAQKAGNGESLRLFHDVCPLERGPGHELRIDRNISDTQSGFSGFPATIHDCAGGRQPLRDAAKQSLPGPERAEWNREVAFFEKSCSQRGVWVWKNDRFVKPQVTTGTPMPSPTALPPPPSMSHP